ncbi:MAG: DUF3482 domain-containing protein [Chloroflexota bacterium]
MEKIKIAVAGHTNTGKTTLIRTLMKSPVGQVGDRPNVTTQSYIYFYDGSTLMKSPVGQDSNKEDITLKGYTYAYDGLQASFIDTPGFRFAQVYNMYLDAIFEDPNYKMPGNWKEKIDLDLTAVKAIGTSNVVLYVGNLNIVPDDGYIEEIKLVKRIQPQMVGILNQAHKVSDKEQLADRITQWKQAFFDSGIDQVVAFDAHWDKYSKVNLIYNQIHEALSRRERKIFAHSLALFKKRQNEIKQEVCKLLSTYIVQIQKIEQEYKKRDYSKDEGKAKQQIRELLRDDVLSFIHDVNELYRIAAEYPADSIESIKGKVKPKPNWKNRMSVGGSAAAVGSAASAAIGAAIGAIAAGLLSGGLGAGPGAVLGAQIGGAVGGGIGILATFDDSEDKVVITLESNEIQDVAQKFTSTIWGLSMNGYGRARDLSKDEIIQIEKHVEELYRVSRLRDADWKTIEYGLIFQRNSVCT